MAMLPIFEMLTAMLRVKLTVQNVNSSINSCGRKKLKVLLIGYVNNIKLQRHN